MTFQTFSKNGPAYRRTAPDHEKREGNGAQNIQLYPSPENQGQRPENHKNDPRNRGVSYRRSPSG